MNRAEFKNGTSMMMKSAELEKLAEWRKWMKKIPSIPFDPDWRVQVIPPFGGAMVRFQVFAKADTENSCGISVYLDCHQQLGIYDGPYWEIYPYEDDVARVGIDAIDELLEKIKKALEDRIVSMI